MDLTPHTILKRAPNLKVQFLYDDSTTIFSHHGWIKCKSHGLAILDVFANPIEICEGVKKLEALFADTTDRAQTLELIYDLYRGGFLLAAAEDLASRADETKPTFSCFLHEQSSRLIPNGRVSQAFVDPRTLVVNKKIQIQTERESSVRSDKVFPCCASFLTGYPLLWVEHPGTKVLAPFWLNDTYRRLIEELLANRMSSSELEPSVVSTLAAANVLVPTGYVASQTALWQKNLADSFRQLQSEQYAVLRNIIHPLQIAALRKYFRTLDHKNFLMPDLQGGSLRYASHNEEVASFIHHQLTTLVQSVTRELIKPSYSFLSVYKSGSFLPKHADRSQCAWNLSLLIDTDPETALSDSWPIYLEVSGQKEIRLEMGDGLLYRGTDVPHWREAHCDGEMTTLILCHFVRDNFEGDLN